jgi:hypothetical protein
MKHSVATKVFLLIVISLILDAPAFSQDTPGISVLVLKEREFDFGKVKEGSRITHEFTVQNKGTVPLEIKKVSPG